MDIKVAGQLIHAGVLEGLEPPDTPEGKYAKAIINALRNEKTQTKFYNGTFYMNYENGIAIIPADNSYKRFIANTWVSEQPPQAQTIFTKPTYEEQLAWLNQQGDSAMVRAIKENVIAVRLHETVINNKTRMDKQLKTYANAAQDVQKFKELIGWNSRTHEKETNR